VIFIKNNPINSLLDISLDNIARMVDINKVIGTPMRVGEDDVVIPVSRVVFGFGAGGSEFSTKSASKAYDLELSEELFPFGGGSGGGINIAPVAFLHIKKGNMEILNINKDSSILDKMFEIGKDLLINEPGVDSKKK
jgi:sporulation protein YtfJ